MKIGTRVEVRNRFDAHWSRGFEIAEIIERQDDLGAARSYRLKRRSDAAVLPTTFPEYELREERRRQTWWQ